MTEKKIKRIFTFNELLEDDVVVAEYLRSFGSSMTRWLVQRLREEAYEWKNDEQLKLEPEVKILDPHKLPYEELLIPELPNEDFFDLSEKLQKEVLENVYTRRTRYTVYDVNNMLDRGLLIPDYIIEDIKRRPHVIEELNLRLPENWRELYDN